MEYDDYLRDLAFQYRQLAENTADALAREELLELATVCEEVANTFEDRLTGG